MTHTIRTDGAMLTKEEYRIMLEDVSKWGGSRSEMAKNAIERAYSVHPLWYTTDGDGKVSSVCSWDVRMLGRHEDDLSRPFNELHPEIRRKIATLNVKGIKVAYLAGRGDGGTKELMEELLIEANRRKYAVYLDSTLSAAGFYPKLGFKQFSDYRFIHFPQSVARLVLPLD